MVDGKRVIELELDIELIIIVELDKLDLGRILGIEKKVDVIGRK
jgi:hypothetical protein